MSLSAVLVLMLLVTDTRETDRVLYLAFDESESGSLTASIHTESLQSLAMPSSSPVYPVAQVEVVERLQAASASLFLLGEGRITREYRSFRLRLIEGDEDGPNGSIWVFPDPINDPELVRFREDIDSALRSLEMSGPSDGVDDSVGFMLGVGHPIPEERRLAMLEAALDATDSAGYRWIREGVRSGWSVQSIRTRYPARTALITFTATATVGCLIASIVLAKKRA